MQNLMYLSKFWSTFLVTSSVKGELLWQLMRDKIEQHWTNKDLCSSKDGTVHGRYIPREEKNKKSKGNIS